MYIVIYFGAILFVVFLVLCVYIATNAERKSHPARLAEATERFDAVFADSAKTVVYRLPKHVVRRLRRTIELEAFYQACKKLGDEDRHRVLSENQDAIIAGQRREKNPTVHAFFAYVLHDLKDNWEDCEGYGELMLRFLEDRSVYARENALKALYSFGDARLVEEALVSLSRRNVHHNEKLVADGLQMFTGDESLLIDLLMEHYDELLECYRNALITFMNYHSIDRYDQRLIEEARRADISVDTLCCIIRKFNKTPSERNLGFLKGLILRFREGDVWEPVAIAVTGLGKYRDNGEVKELLKKELLARNWYIRKNSAAALVSIGVTQEDIDDIYAQNDRYAIDAINYELGRAVHV